jgi:DNA-binding transcriptional LysR family regulator
MALARITLRQFEAFSAIAELRSFGMAGERLGMTASAVSQLVAEFESNLGFRLFDRTTRQVSLSSAGRDFLGSAESVLKHVQAAETVANDVRQRAVGVVRIGAPLVLAATALPMAIKAYQAKRPKVVIRIHDISVDGLVNGVASGDVDLAIGPDWHAPSTVSRETVFDSPWVLWCTPSHPLAKFKKLRWAQLLREPLVAAGRDHERTVAQMLINAPVDARVTPVHVVSNITTALGIASQGLAATLAPAYVEVIANNFGLVMRRVLEPETVRQVCIYRPTARNMSPAVEGFAEYLAHWLKAWASGG